MGEVNINLTRTHGLLTATLLALALSTAGCGGSTEPTSKAAIPHASTSKRDPQLPPPRDLPGKTGPHDPFDTSNPAIGQLSPDLLQAVQEAAKDAKADGVPMYVNSGWRSRDEQQRLFEEAVAEFDSEEEALRYVATPDTSAHITGDAVDIGPTDAMSWLSQHGSDYGLCQTFANEMWHYELSTTPFGVCPEMLPDGSSRN